MTNPDAAQDHSAPAEVAAVFASYPSAVQADLRRIRRLIFDTAHETAGVGRIDETLKWGQPSYLTSETRSGSTIRLAATAPGSPHDYAVYFICHTNLVRTFERLFGEVLTYEGNRGLLFTTGEVLPLDELRECIRMALTYHRSKP